MKFLYLQVIVSLLVWQCAEAKNPPPATALSTSPATWMEGHLRTLANLSLKQLAMPASHDAGMYVSGFPQILGKTQNLCIDGQLRQGVRYFDLRLQYKAGELNIHHDFIAGPRLMDVLDDVRRFLTEGHRELVILKFSHFEGFNLDHYITAAALIRDRLRPWMYMDKPRNRRLAEITLGEYVRASGTVLIVCDGEYPVSSPHPGIWIYRDWDSADPAAGDLRVFDQFSNTMSYDRMKVDQLAKFRRYTGKCKNAPELACDLFLLSWTLTPPTDVPALAKDPDRKLLAVMTDTKVPNPAGCYVNLLYTDCVEQARLVDAAMLLNTSASRHTTASTQFSR